MALKFKNINVYKKFLEPFLKNPKKKLVICFSGGRTSGYMLWHIVKACGGVLPPNIVVCFQNTGLEAPETLDFVQMLATYLNIKIYWLERDWSSPDRIREVNHNSASRNGEPFMSLFMDPVEKRKDGTRGLRPLANPTLRICTSSLKIKTLDKFLRKRLGWPARYWAAVGFRADEEARARRRIKKDKPYLKKGLQGGLSLFPLRKAGATVDDVMEFWDGAPFDLGIDGLFGNCMTCFMKSVWKIKEVMKARPEAAQVMIAIEEAPRDRSNRFRKGRPSYRELFEQVQRGDMSATNDQMQCGTCTD